MGIGTAALYGDGSDGDVTINGGDSHGVAG
jgi:hypothetical protein